MANNSIDEKLESLNNAIAKVQNRDFVFDKAKTCTYVTAINAVVPDPGNFNFFTYPVTDGYKTPKKVFSFFAGREGNVMTKEEMITVFFQTRNQPSE